MRDSCRTRLQKPVGLLLLLCLILSGWIAACTPTAAEAPVSEAQPYTFYLNTWTEKNNENRIVPLDPETLTAQPESEITELGRMWRLSADGTTLVSVEMSGGRANQNPEDSRIIVHDFPSGVERHRFQPPAGSIVSDLSQDGARLLLQADVYPYTKSAYPPTVEWYVVDTASGESLAHITDSENACFRQAAQLDPAGRRIYCVVDPALTAAEAPGPMQIVAYDVESGARAGELMLPDVLFGRESVEHQGQMLESFLEPTLTLAPDGQQLAVVHADSDKVTLIEAQTLRLQDTFSLEHDSIGWGVAPVQAKGQLEGTIRQAAFSADGRFLYVFTQDVSFASDPEPVGARGLWLVDVEQGQMAAEALADYQIQWVQPAPDGTVYAFGTPEEDLGPYEIRFTSPSRLWRLDGRTLAVLAERSFDGYRSGRLVLGEAAKPALEAVEKEAASADCPVTQPPKSAFIPPEPWPAQPPGADQFWYGDSSLWTALPASGNWQQMLLGEKFWWWSEEFDVAEAGTPDLTVTARRLDGQAPAFQVTEATNGYHESFNWAMLIGVDLAVPGCWEFTAEYKGHQLSLVLWVPPE